MRQKHRSLPPRDLPRRFVCFFLFAALAVPTLQGREEWSGVERIVAIGDVHGDFEQFTALLRQTGLIDGKQNWSGGETHLVQTGDVPDRGPDSRKVFDLLMKLEKQSKKAGGLVHPLIGNHEAMNMYGDLRYVHPGEYAAFASPRSQELRERYYDLHVEQVKRNPPPEGLPLFGPEYKQQWMEKHSPGYFEHRLAFDASRGEYGRWISGNNTVIKINDVLFLHGGLSPKYAGFSLKDIDKTVQEELRDFDKLRGGMAIDSEGPLWYRGLAQHSEAEELAHLENILAQHGAKHIVIGHTVTDGTVMPRFGGKVLMIDVGMSALYGGHQACLVIEKGRPFTVHRGTKVALPLGGGDAELVEYLKQAAALDPQPSPLEAKIAEIESRLAAAR